MSGKTKMLGFGKVRGEVVEGSEASDASQAAEAGEPGASAAVNAPTARLIEPRRPSDPLQEARDLEDAAMAYSEVVHVLGAITRTTQAGEDSYAGLTLKDMAENLESAWDRWDKAQRRLIGQQRTA